MGILEARMIKVFDLLELLGIVEGLEIIEVAALMGVLVASEVASIQGLPRIFATFINE